MRRVFLGLLFIFVYDCSIAQIEIELDNYEIHEHSDSYDLVIKIKLKNISSERVFYINDFNFHEHSGFPFIKNEKYLDSIFCDFSSTEMGNNELFFNRYFFDTSKSGLFYKDIITENPIDSKDYFKRLKNTEQRRKKETKMEKSNLIKEFRKTHGSLKGFKKDDVYKYMKIKRHINSIEPNLVKELDVSIPIFKNEYQNLFSNENQIEIFFFSYLNPTNMIEILGKIDNITKGELFLGCLKSNKLKISFTGKND